MPVECNLSKIPDWLFFLFFFPDIIFTFHTFSSSGKLYYVVCRFPWHFFKYSRLWTNPIEDPIHLHIVQCTSLMSQRTINLSTIQYKILESYLKRSCMVSEDGRHTLRLAWHHGHLCGLHWPLSACDLGLPPAHLCHWHLAEMMGLPVWKQKNIQTQMWDVCDTTVNNGYENEIEKDCSFEGLFVKTRSTPETKYSHKLNMMMLHNRQHHTFVSGGLRCLTLETLQNCTYSVYISFECVKI